MDALRVACPACRTPLRFRDPDAVASPFDCPECGVSLALNAAGEPVPAGELPATAPDPASAPRAQDVDASSILDAAPNATPHRAFDQLDATPRDVASDDDTSPSETRRWGTVRWRTAASRLGTPAGIAWTLAAAVAVAFAIAIVASGDRTPGDEGERAAEAQPGDPAAPSEPGEDVDEPRERLADLAARLGRYRARHGRLPAGASGDALPADERLSWIARLEASGNLGAVAPPRWDRSFRNPANAEFVQRPRPAFLNPAIGETRAADGYPATHFVGVGGVGPEAPDAPSTDTRAGMFGNGRAASAEEVGDGLANTMMVAGVQASLGSWAAGGTGTVRPFTAEPYVNGPDGFGTGGEGEMLVLMGDGSVRTLPADTDPRIVRRMAAMNDGLDLELERPGEPGDRPSIEPEPPAVAVADPPQPAADDPPEPAAEDDPPAEEPLPEIALPELPRWTPELVAAKLAQPIVGLQTRRPVEAGVLLEEMADMVGVPIHLKVEDGIDQAFLSRPISLTVEKGTIGQALDALLAKLDLRYVVEEDGLRLKPIAEEAED
jgi:hypothetical protein